MKTHLTQNPELTNSVNYCDDERGSLIDFPPPDEITPLLNSTKSVQKLTSTKDFDGISRTSVKWADDASCNEGGGGSYLASLTSIRHLQKSVGVLQSFSLIVGVLLGSGVFISPALVMADTHDAGLALLLWVGCGLIALGGSLCYCELGCSIKRAGGNYAYIQEAYGDLPAFLSCWTVAFVIEPSAIATITLTLGTYVMKPFEHLVPESSPWYAKSIAAVVIFIIAFINCWSVRATNRIQTVFTFAQITAVSFVAVVGLWMLGKGHTQNLKSEMFNASTISWSNIGILGSALYNGMWAYDGWALVSNITEEMTDLNRNLFLSIITGIPFVICCYILVNISFLSVLTVEQIAQSPAVAVTFIQNALGDKVAYIMPILVALSCYGAANGSLYACGRLSLAAGREGHLPDVLSMIHKKRHTPIPAVLLTASISMMMLLPDASQLETLISIFNFACWTIYGLSLFAVIVLRITRPDMERPYRVWILTPILMTIISIVFVIIPFFTDPVNPIISASMILLGVPFYFVFVYMEPKHPNSVVSLRKSIRRKIQDCLNLAPCTNNLL